MRDVGGRDATWGEVHDFSLRWAAVCRGLGVDEGQTVVTMMPTCFEGFYVWLGVSWLKAIEVPVNNMYRGDMLRYVIATSEATVAIIASRFLDVVAEVLAETRLTTIVVSDADDTTVLPSLPVTLVRGAATIDQTEGASGLEGPDVWDIGAMVFTSGTTGPSKGVLVPWGEFFQWPQFLPDGFVGAGEPYYSFFPLYHLGGKCTLYNAALNHAYLLLRETFSVSEFWDDVRTHGVRATTVVGPMVAMLQMSPPAPDDADNPLEQIATGPVIPDIGSFQERFGVKRVVTGFGTTEIGFPIASPWDPEPGMCGKLREGPPHYEVRIVDDHDFPVPAGTVGELVVRAGEPWVMNLGYWRAPEKTAHAWRNGWFHTGDAFRQDADGWLYFMDRIDDTLRRRGENISSFEVEQEVLAHPDVAECAVVAVPSVLGEDDVKAVVVRRPDTALTAPDLVAFLEPRTASFMIPRYVEFVDSLPKTEATLRVRKVELRSNALNGRTWDRETGAT